jgi:sugar lactone lactonase YvrE
MRILALVAALAGLVACTPAPSSTSSASGPTPTERASGISATGAAAVTCPPPAAFSSLTVFANVGGSPDDLLANADGGVWVTDPAGGTIRRLDAHGHVINEIADGNAPEGMAVLRDGRMLIAEQRMNRIVSLRLPSTTLTTFATLPPAGASLGVDAIALDTRTGGVLVPDSAHGTLLLLGSGGYVRRVVASGLGRPVDAAMAGDGSIYVAVEGTGGLVHVLAKSGRTAAVEGISQADDVIVDGAVVYATEIESGTLIAFDTASNEHHVLVTHIGQPQGLALLSDGRLAVADSRTGTIAVTAPCTT